MSEAKNVVTDIINYIAERVEALPFAERIVAVGALAELCDSWTRIATEYVSGEKAFMRLMQEQDDE